MAERPLHAMNPVAASTLRSGRRLRVRSHEVVVHTSPAGDSSHHCFVFLFDPFAERHELKVFRGTGATAEEAEETTLKEALAFLDHPAGKYVSTILAGRNTLTVAGRKVDIFCDHLPDGTYQAFPFLYRPDGTRVVILRFHLSEVIVGETPREAITRCIDRLEEHFLRRRSAAERADS
ncbi:MAG TPA: hypothetical protein VNI57_02545 [Candidatus Saccharimonadales bacterium]|nr:hypothetical protein [Candidatus Saccharimonadales bacterium]